MIASLPFLFLGRSAGGECVCWQGVREPASLSAGSGEGEPGYGDGFPLFHIKVTRSV